MADHRQTTFFAQHCKALSRQAKAGVLAIGCPQNFNNKCVSGGQRPEQTVAIEINALQCCTISDWQSNDSNPVLLMRHAESYSLWSIVSICHLLQVLEMK